MVGYRNAMMIVAVFVLGCFAASAGNWSLVNTIVVGFFALMNLKGDQIEKTVTSITSKL